MLALAMPALFFQRLIEMLSQAAGRYRLWAVLVLGRATAIGFTATVGALLIEGNDPSRASLLIAICIPLASVTISRFGLTRLGLPTRPAIRHFLVPYSATVSAALSVIFLDTHLFARHGELTRILGANTMLAILLGISLLLMSSTRGVLVMVVRRIRG